MSAALVGVIGALAGLVVGSGYSFWSTRRSELAQALIAAYVLAEELRVHARRRVKAPADFTGLQRVWDEHRASFVLHMSPGDFHGFADSLPLGSDAHGLPSDELIETVDALAELFWKEHQALILVPLVNYARRNTMSKRVHTVLERGRIDPNTEPPKNED